MATPRAGDKCCIHLLRFAEIEEFPGEAPDIDGVLVSFAAHRCQRNVLDRDGNYLRVPLCSEDVEETENVDLFDGQGYFVRACAQHAAWLNTHAVEHRARAVEETRAGGWESAEAEAAAVAAVERRYEPLQNRDRSPSAAEETALRNEL